MVEPTTDYRTLWLEWIAERDALRAELEDTENLIRALVRKAARRGVRLGQDAPTPSPSTLSPPVVVAPPLTVADGPESAEPEDEAPVPVQPTGSNGVGVVTENRGVYSSGVSSSDAALHVMWGNPSRIWPTPEIALSIEQGGFPSTSANFKVNVYTTMKRLRKRGFVNLVGEGRWELTERGCAAALEVAERLENATAADVGASAAAGELAL